jgi:lysophospholipase L1-like esterase
MSPHSRPPRPGAFSVLARLRAWLPVACLLAFAPALPAQTKVMTNGDSITFGIGASNTDTQSYSAQLARLLGGAYTVQKDGTGGATLLKAGQPSFWNTQGIRITTETNPGIIYIMLGTNDSKAGNWLHRDQFVRDYLELVDRYAALPARPRIFLGLPPPATASNGDVNGPTVANEIIPRILEVARQRNLQVIDAHSPFLEPFRSLLPDGIHPNDAGHGVIAAQIRDAILHGRSWSPTPAAWTRTDIGNTGHAGADAIDETQAHQILAGGAGLVGASDSLRFLHQNATGDLELTARVLGQRNADPLVATRADASAGLMVREGTGAGARFAAVVVTPGAGVSFRWRDAADASLGSATVANAGAPMWLRLRRSGNTFAAFASTDGQTWQQVGASRSIAMSGALAGLVASSALPATLSHVRIDRVTVSGSLTGGTGNPTDPNPPTTNPPPTTGTDGGTGGGVIAPATAGFDPSAQAARTVVNGAFSVLLDPALPAWRLGAETAANRPLLGVLGGGSTREAAGFDGQRTFVGPRAQDLFTPGVSQDFGFVGVVRVPASGGSGRAHLLCLNKNATEPAAGLGFDYAGNRFFASFTQAFNGAPSEIFGPVVARGATYLVRLQKTGGVVRLRVDGALAAETNSARPAILAAGEGGSPVTIGGLRPLNPQFVGQLGRFHLRNAALTDADAASLETELRAWIGAGSTGGDTTPPPVTNPPTTNPPTTGDTGGGGVTLAAGLDPSAAASRTLVQGAYAALVDPANSAWRFTGDPAINRPLLGVFAGTTREAAGFDGLRTFTGPRAQDLWTPGVAQDAAFLAAVRIPPTGGSGRALIFCLNKNATEPALGVGYDYQSGRFFLAFTQAFNGAPSEVAGPLAPRGATYVLRLQKTAGTVRLHVNGALAAEATSARPALLATGEGAPVTLGGLRALNPQFVGQLGKFHLRAAALGETEAAALEADLRAWLGAP